MTTYFGQQTHDSDEGCSAGIWIKHKAYSTGMTCPGSGSQVVTTLEGYFGGVAGTGHVRMAVLDVSNNVLCQGSSEITITTTTGWFAHTTFTGNTTLTGGVSYRLVFSADSTDISAYYISGSNGDTGYDLADYTGGFPASLGAGDDYDLVFTLRCGVDPPDSSIEQEGFRFRNDDGSEAAATWKDSQDANITLAANTSTRIRTILNATGDPASIGAQLEYRYKPSGGAFGSWTKVQ